MTSSRTGSRRPSGARSTRWEIPVAKVTRAEAKGGDVDVKFHRGTAVFAGVGTGAALWAKRFGRA